jgi:hypothetical protein
MITSGFQRTGFPQGGVEDRSKEAHGSNRVVKERG